MGQPTGKFSQDLDAIHQAVHRSRCGLLLIDAIDLAGADAAVQFCNAAGFVLDHCRPSHLPALQEHGFVTTMPGEAFERADVVLTVGPMDRCLKTDETLQRLTNQDDPKTRTQVSLQSPNDKSPSLDLLELIGCTRALVGDRPARLDDVTNDRLSQLVETCKDAAYGVALFDAQALSFVEQVSLMALIDELSTETRWTLLPIGIAPGQTELARMTLARTGQIVPMQFKAGRAHHDANIFGAENLLARSECDLVIYVSSNAYQLPNSLALQNASLITITSEKTPPPGSQHHIQVGVAGVDYPALLEPPELGSVVSIAPTQTNSDHPTIAAVLTAMETGVTTDKTETVA